MRLHKVFILTVLILLSGCLAAAQDLYTYKDDAGILHTVSSLDDVPEEYRSTDTTIGDTPTSSDEGAEAALQYYPLDLRPGERLSFAPDLRLNAAASGTIELLLRVSENLKHDAPILSHGTGASAYYVISFLSGSGTVAIRFQDGTVVDSQVRVDDGSRHHIAFTNDDGRICSVVDGRTTACSEAIVPFASTGPRLLHLGSDGNTATFAGDIFMVRFWDSALTDLELPEAENGPVPDSDHPAFDHWIASTSFSPESFGLVYTRPAIRTTFGLGLLTDQRRDAIAPFGSTVTAVHFLADDDGILDIRLSVADVSGEALLVPDDSNTGRSDPSSSLTDDLERIRKSLKAEQADWTTIVVDEDRSINGIAGTFDMWVRSIRLLFSGTASSRAGPLDQSRSENVGKVGRLAASDRIPRQGQFAGFSWWLEKSHIALASLLYRTEPRSTVDAQLIPLLERRLIDQNSRGPRTEYYLPSKTTPYVLEGIANLSENDRSKRIAPILEELRGLQGLLNGVWGGTRFLRNHKKDIHRLVKAADWFSEDDEPALLGVGPDNTKYALLVAIATRGAAKLAEQLTPTGLSAPTPQPIPDVGPKIKELLLALSSLGSVLEIPENITFLVVGSPDTQPAKDILASLGPWSEYPEEPSVTLPPEWSSTPADPLYRSYVTDPVYRLFATRGARTLILLSESGDHVSFSASSPTDARWIGEKDAVAALAWGPGLRTTDLPGASPGQPHTLIPAPLYEASSDDKLDWGGTFALADRPSQSTASFRGYNLSNMSPTSFHRDSGASGLVFQYPAPSSKDYYTTDNRVIVPYGFHYVPMAVGEQKATSTTVRSTHQLTEHWNAHIGIKGGAFGFGVSSNIEWGAEKGRFRANGSNRAIATTIQERYSLSVDWSRVQLSYEFRERVERLRDMYLATDSVPQYEWTGFIERFGTHLAESVIYGGMAKLESDSSESEYKTTDGNSLSVEMSLQLELGELSGGISGGYSSSTIRESDSLKSFEKKTFRTYGGTISAGEGWSVPKGEEVPIFVDLERISNLFSPLFFHDPVVFVELRKEVDLAIDEYLQTREESP